jgi:hypothetical protein
VAACIFVLVPGFAALSAQMVASRDLTLGWRVPNDRISVPATCQQSGSSIANDEPPANAGNPSAEANPLQLTISSISPSSLEIGNDFTAKVQLKNIGTGTVLVPSYTDGERVLRVSADNSAEQYEVGDVSFRLLTGKDHSTPVFLNSSGALFADPEEKSSYLPLEPGNWLEIKVEGRVECGLEDCPGEIHPDSKAALTGWWYQRVLSHRINGCNEIHGSAKVLEAASQPLPVVIRNPLAKPGKTTPKK